MTVLGDDQRIDLDEARVALAKQLGKLAQDVAQLALLLGAEPKPEADLARLVVLEAGRRMQRQRENFLWSLVRDLFDIHTAGGRCHHGDPLGAPIDDQAQVQLALDRRAGLDVDVIDGQAFGATLVRDEPRAEHRFGVLLDLGHRFGELDAAGLAAAARMNLSFHDPEAAARAR